MRPRRRSTTPSAYRSASAAAPVGAGERAAAIFVCPRANAESVGVVGRHAFRLPVRADAVDESSSLLFRLKSRSNRLRRRRARPVRDGWSRRRRGRKLWETSKSHRGWRPCFSSRTGVLPMNCTWAAAPQADCYPRSMTVLPGGNRPAKLSFGSGPLVINRLRGVLKPRSAFGHRTEQHPGRPGNKNHLTIDHLDPRHVALCIGTLVTPGGWQRRAHFCPN